MASQENEKAEADGNYNNNDNGIFFMLEHNPSIGQIKVFFLSFWLNRLHPQLFLYREKEKSTRIMACLVFKNNY